MTVMKCRAWKVLSHIHMTFFKFNCESVLLLSTDDTWYPSSCCFACPPLYFVAVIFKAVGVGCVEKSKSLMLPGFVLIHFVHFGRKEEVFVCQRILGNLLIGSIIFGFRNPFITFYFSNV
jgi:hypothetical protein